MSKWPFILASMKQLFTEKLHRTTRRHILHKRAYFLVPRYCTAPVHSVRHFNHKLRASYTIMNTYNHIVQFAQNLRYMTENENITASQNCNSFPDSMKTHYRHYRSCTNPLFSVYLQQLAQPLLEGWADKSHTYTHTIGTVTWPDCHVCII